MSTNKPLNTQKAVPKAPPSLRIEDTAIFQANVAKDMTKTDESVV
jgi:hypothetical protein